MLESFDAKSTATDDVEELAAEPVAAAPALAATEVTLAATESTVAEVAEVQAAAAPAVVEQVRARPVLRWRVAQCGPRRALRVCWSRAFVCTLPAAKLIPSRTRSVVGLGAVG